MLASTEEWTVVLAGRWNAGIFSQAWVGKHLFHNDRVEMLVGVGLGIQQLRYISQNVILIPGDHKVVIGVRSIADDSLCEAEHQACSILELLPHTPLSAVGVNFGFVEQSPGPEILKLFQLSDLHSLSVNVDEVLRTELVRQLNTKEGVLNLKHAFHDGQVKVHLNFHCDTESPEKAAGFLKGSIHRRREYAVTLLEDVYGLTLEHAEAETETK
jgi:hypothetical protein